MFKSVLQKLNEQIEDALGVLVVARDGIILEQETKPSEINFELLAAEFAALAKGMRRFSKGAELGHSYEMTLQTDKTRLLAKFLTDEYYLVLALKPAAQQGRAGHELRKAQLILESEFSS